jgi:hypothetical protein
MEDLSRILCMYMYCYLPLSMYPNANIANSANIINTEPTCNHKVKNLCIHNYSMYIMLTVAKASIRLIVKFSGCFIACSIGKTIPMPIHTTNHYIYNIHKA